MTNLKCLSVALVLSLSFSHASFPNNSTEGDTRSYFQHAINNVMELVTDYQEILLWGTALLLVIRYRSEIIKHSGE